MMDYLRIVPAGMLAMAFCGCSGSADMWSMGQPAASPDLASPAVVAGPADASETTGNKVVVYNIAGTFGCLCNVVAGKMARQTVEEVFPQDLAAGRIVWREVTSSQRPDLGQRYGVKGSNILVVGRANGRDVSYKTLDRVCQLYLLHDLFHAYVANEVKAVLAEVQQQSASPAVPRR